jgi:tRNA pseudouridine13 synthase
MDFRGAVARLWPESHGLYLAAYQSHIWNRMLAELIRRQFGDDNCVTIALKTAVVPAPRRLPREHRDRLAGLELPLPSARLRFDPDAMWAPLVIAALADQGFELHEMKLPGLRKPFFSKGDRLAWVVPQDVSAQYRDDDQHAGKFKLMLSFELPRGSYATIFTKRVLQAK